jgi:hypothetical protein
MIKRLFTDLTPFIPLSIIGRCILSMRGKELFLKGLRPFNLPLMNSLSKEG